MNITLDNARIAVNAALEEGIVPGKPLYSLFFVLSFILGWWISLFPYIYVLMYLQVVGLHFYMPLRCWACSNLKTLISKLVLRFYRMLLRFLFFFFSFFPDFYWVCFFTYCCASNCSIFIIFDLSLIYYLNQQSSKEIIIKVRYLLMVFYLHWLEIFSLLNLDYNKIRWAIFSALL